MISWHMRRHAASGIVVASTFAAATALSQSDVAGSADPTGMPRFPGAWIDAYAPEASLRSYEFITGEVARVRREVRIDRSVRIAANLARVTYRTPSGTRLTDVIAHYEDVVRDLGGQVEFTCRGQDCGHSTIWANQVFGIKELAAPDAAQFYLATTIKGTALGLSEARSAALVSIYVVQRPNRRVNAHVDFAIPTSPTSGSSGEDTVNSLNVRGYTVIEGAAPNALGELSEDALRALDDLAQALKPLSGRIVVVCHLGSEDSAKSTTRSQACAEAASSRLGAAGVEARAFGAGPFLPREGVPHDRLEMVLPGGSQAP